MISLDILSDMDETLGSAGQSGLKRIRSWHVADPYREVRVL
jgi:hypothetical protein